MKLIKIVRDFNVPLKENVLALFPRDNEWTISHEYIIVSDAKFRLLEFAGVKMYVHKSFSETTVVNLDNFLKEDYYVLTNVIKPSKFDPESFDPTTYDLGDLIFFYEAGPEKPVAPVEPKFHEGTFNYELPEPEKKALIEKYEEELAAYEEALEAYESEFEAFLKTEGDLPAYGALGVITDFKGIIPKYNASVYDRTPSLVVRGDKKLYIVWSNHFEITKDVDQFGVFGKLPKSVGTKVTENVGGLKANDSVKGWSIERILTKLFGLQKEKEYVGTIQPDGEKKKDKVTASISYGEGKTSIGALTDTATITATFTLSEESKATNVKLMNGDTVVETKAIGDEVTFSVTGLSTTTAYKIVGYHVDSETSEEVVDSQTTATVVVNFVAPTLGALSATPSTVDNTSTPVEFQITVNEGSAPITSVKLYTSADVEVGSMTPIDLNDNVYGYTLNSVTETTGYYVKAVDANGSEKKSNTATVTLNVVGPNGTLTVSPTSLTAVGTVTITATATEGSAALTKVELFVDDVLTGTVTSDFTPENLTWEDDDVEATTEYKIVITDANNVTKTLTETVTFTVQNPTVTLSAAPTAITTKTADVVLTIQATKKSFDLSKIEVFDGDTLLETYTTSLDAQKTYTVTGVNAAKTFNVKVTDAKGNEGTASKAVAYNYVAPTMTVTSVTPTSTDNPITPSSVVTVTVVCSEATGATGTNVKLYRNSVAVANLIDTITYAPTTTFTVNGPQTNGDKFVAVLTYDSDGDTKTAQKTSAAITVETPPTQVYYGNCLWIPTLKALFVASDGNRDTLPSDWNNAVAEEFMTTTVSQVHLAKFAAAAGTYDSNTNAEPMPEIENDPAMQAAYIVPSTFTVHFTQNGADVDSAMVTQNVTVDGINYTVYMWNSVSFDNVEQCKIYLS